MQAHRRPLTDLSILLRRVKRRRLLVHHLQAYDPANDHGEEQHLPYCCRLMPGGEGIDDGNHRTHACPHRVGRAHGDGLHGPAQPTHGNGAGNEKDH